jgi:biotin carboxyl carrier protein
VNSQVASAGLEPDVNATTSPDHASEHQTEKGRRRAAAEAQDQQEQAQTQGESVGLAVRLLVSPDAGRLRHLPPVEFHDGAEWVSAGQCVAIVEQGRISVEVRSPIDARVAGILVRDGEPVAQGQPLVWLEEAPRRTTSAERPGDRT